MLLQGKRKPVRSLSLVLAAILFLGMVLIPADKTKAEETQVVVADMNKSDTAITYHTGPLGTYTCSFTMPENGTLELVHTGHGSQNMQVTITDSVGKTYTHSTCNWEFAEDEMLEGVYVSEEHKFFTNLTGGQTYTLTFHSESNLQDALFRLRFAANTATLKSGKAIYGGVKKGCKSYYKINVPKNGYLKVQFQYVCCGGLQYQVRLLNAKKQPMRKFSDSITKKSKYTTYGVKKGIYYLEVKTKSASRVLYKIKATVKAVKTNAGAKKSGAVTMKRGKVIKGVIYTDNKKASAKHWYKFKVTKRKKVTLYVTTKNSGQLEVAVIPANGRGTVETYFNDEEGNLQLYTTGNKGKTLEPGVYYVSVRSYYYGSGYYSLKWN